MKLAIAVFAFFIAVSMVQADGMADTNVTTDSVSAAVDAGKGEIFWCSNNPQDFFCVAAEDYFICYGWSNCNALGAIHDAPNPVVFLPPYVTGSFPTTVNEPAAPTKTPESSSLLLLASGLAGLIFRKR
jgi:hypothetical protein